MVSATGLTRGKPQFITRAQSFDSWLIGSGKVGPPYLDGFPPENANALHKLPSAFAP